jgi:GMP synthase-like glutamine amidotransferase
MKVLVINNADRELEGKFATPIADIIGEQGGVEVEVLHWSALSREVLRKGYGAFISTGSSQGDDPMPTHGPLYRELGLLTLSVPFFGICTGFHLQAHLRGMLLIRDSQSESGFVDISVVEGKKDDPIFKGMGGTFKAVEMHNDSMDLPPSFELLASTERCPVQLIKSTKLPLFYCSQFHPEQREEGSNDVSPAAQLIRNFIALASKHSGNH